VVKIWKVKMIFLEGWNKLRNKRQKNLWFYVSLLITTLTLRRYSFTGHKFFRMVSFNLNCSARRVNFRKYRKSTIIVNLSQYCMKKIKFIVFWADSEIFYLFPFIDQRTRSKNDLENLSTSIRVSPGSY
jgi:hypothetical protein